MMLLGFSVRLISVLAQIGSVALIVEKADKETVSIYFLLLALSLVLGPIGTLAFPLRAFPFINRQRGASAIAAALQIQVPLFIFISSALALICYWRQWPILPGLGLFVSATISQNHFFHRHFIIARALPRLSILIYESSQALIFSLIILGITELWHLTLDNIVAAAIASAMAGWMVGIHLSKSSRDWTKAARMIVAFAVPFKFTAIWRHIRHTLPLLFGQITQTLASNFPIFAASFFGNAESVVALGLMQRLLGVVQTLGWLQVVTYLPLYFVERTPYKAVKVVFMSAALLCISTALAGTFLQLEFFKSVLAQTLPNATDALVELSQIPTFYLLPGLILIAVHLEQIFIGANRLESLLKNRQASLLAMVCCFFALHQFSPIGVLACIVSSYALYFIAQIGISKSVYGRYLKITRT